MDQELYTREHISTIFFILDVELSLSAFEVPKDDLVILIFFHEWAGTAKWMKSKSWVELPKNHGWMLKFIKYKIGVDHHNPFILLGLRV
jgi:hypothetical protein